MFHNVIIANSANTDEDGGSHLDTIWVGPQFEFQQSIGHNISIHQEVNSSFLVTAAVNVDLLNGNHAISWHHTHRIREEMHFITLSGERPLVHAILVTGDTHGDAVHFELLSLHRSSGMEASSMRLLSTCSSKCGASIVEETEDSLRVSVITKGFIAFAGTDCASEICQDDVLWSSESSVPYPVILDFEILDDRSHRFTNAFALFDPSDDERYLKPTYFPHAVMKAGSVAATVRAVEWPTGEVTAEVNSFAVEANSEVQSNDSSSLNSISRSFFPNNLVTLDCSEACLDGGYLELELLPLPNPHEIDLAEAIPSIHDLVPSTACQLTMDMHCASLNFGNAEAAHNLTWRCEGSPPDQWAVLDFELQSVWFQCQLSAIRTVDEQCLAATEQWCTETVLQVSRSLNATCVEEFIDSSCAAACVEGNDTAYDSFELSYHGYSATAMHYCMKAHAQLRTWDVENQMEQILNAGHSLTHAPVDSCMRQLDQSCAAVCGTGAQWLPSSNYESGSCGACSINGGVLQQLQDEWTECYLVYAQPRRPSVAGTAVSPASMPSHIMLTGVASFGPLIVPFNASGFDILYGQWQRFLLPLEDGTLSFWMRGSPINNNISQARVMWPLRREMPSVMKGTAPWYHGGHEGETTMELDVSSLDALSGFAVRITDLPTWGIRKVAIRTRSTSRPSQPCNVCGMVQLLVGPEEFHALPNPGAVKAPPTSLAPMHSGFGESESLNFGYFRTYDSFALHLLDLGCRCLNGAILSFDIMRLTNETAIRSISLTSSPGLSSASATVSLDVSQQLSSAVGEWLHVEGTVTDATDNLNPRQLVGMRLLYDGNVGSATAQRFIMRDLRLTRPCFSRWFTYDERPLEVQVVEDGGYVNKVVNGHLGVREAEEPFLENGEFYRILTVGSNVWGEETPPVCTRTFTVDDSPPDISEWAPFDILPGPELLAVDVDFIGTPIVRVAWRGEVKEPESSPDGTVDYYIAAVTRGSPDGPDVFVAEGKDVPIIRQSLSSLGYLESRNGSLPHMIDGEYYFVHVGVMNRGRVESLKYTDGFMYDGSAPYPRIPGTRGVAERSELLGLTLEDVDAMNTTSSLVIAWDIIEPHSAVASLHVGIGSTPTFPDIEDWVEVSEIQGEREFLVDPGLALDGNYPVGIYYGLVRACNSANVCAVLSGDGVVVDLTPPSIVVLGNEMFTLHDGISVSSDATNGHSPLRLYWECTDDEAGYYNAVQATANEDLRWMLHYRVCIGEDCTGPTTRWIEGGQDSIIDTDPLLSLLPEARSASLIRVEGCCSNAAVRQCGESIGRPLSIFAQRPDASSAFVEDKDASRPEVAGDIDFIATHLTPVLSASWSGIEGLTDDSLAFYEVAVATSPNFTQAPAPKFLVAPDEFVDTDGSLIGKASPRRAEYLWVWYPTALSTTWSSNPQLLQLVEGVTYYVYVRGWSKAGVISNIIVSDGVLVDNTPPDIRDAQVRDTIPPVANWCEVRPCAVSFDPQSGVNLDVASLRHLLRDGIGFTSSATSVAAFWFGFTDPESGIARYRWGIGSCAEGADPASFNTQQMQVVESPEAFTVEVQMFQGLHFCVGVAAENHAGMLSNYVYSFGVTLDITPPSLMYARDGPPPSPGTVYKEVDSQPSRTALMVHWMASDPTSGIAEQELRLLQAPSTPGAQPVALTNWTAVGPAATTAVVPAPYLLAHGKRYYVELRITNGALLQTLASTDGVIVDTTAPHSYNASVFHNFERLDVQYSSNTKVVRASWEGFEDPETAITEFWWSVGTSRHETDVVNTTYLGSATYAEVAVDLSDGTQLFVTVWASNDAGLTSFVRSAAVMVDSSPPAFGTIRVIGREVQGVKYISTRAHLFIVLEGFEDDTAVAFEVAVQNSDGVDNNVPGMHVPWTPVGENRSIELHDLNLNPGMRYSLHVRAINRAGLATPAISQAFMVDDHAPTPGIVERVDPVYSRTPTVTCAWHSFEDDDSGILLWRVGVGSSPGATNLRSFVTLNISVEAKVSSQRLERTFDLSGIPSGSAMFCAVVAADHVGQWSEVVVGPPVYYDATPPVMSQPVLGSLASYEHKYIELENPVFRVKWLPVRDPESGIATLSYCLGSELGLCDREPMTDVPAYFTTLTLSLPNASDHSTVYFTLFAKNNVGLAATSPTASLVVLSKANFAESVRIKALYLHAYPSLPRDACTCVDPAAAFDFEAQECVCGPGHYLAATSMVDRSAGECQPCPAGTCKAQYGNSLNLCGSCSDGILQSEPTTPPALPLCNQSHVDLGLANGHSTAASKEVFSEAHRRCLCGPGFYREEVLMNGELGRCIPCPLGTAKQIAGDEENLCGLCYKQEASKGVVAVEWYHPLSVQDLSMEVPAGYLVSIDHYAAATRWTQFVPSSAQRGERHIAVFTAEALGVGLPTLLPLPHSARYSARVVLLPELPAAEDLSPATSPSQLVAIAHAKYTVDTTPPGFGVVVDGPTAIDVDVQTNPTALSITWRRWHDGDLSANPSEPRHLSYSVGFGASQGDLTVSDGWMEVPEGASTFTLTGLSLCHGCTFYGALRVISPTNAVTIAYTDGVTITSDVPKADVQILGDWALSRYLELSSQSNGTWSYLEPKLGEGLALQHALYQSDPRGLIVSWRYGAHAPLRLDQHGKYDCIEYTWGILQSHPPLPGGNSSMTNSTPSWIEAEDDPAVASLLAEGYSWRAADRQGGCDQMAAYGSAVDPLETALVPGVSYIAVVVSTSPMGLHAVMLSPGTVIDGVAPAVLRAEIHTLHQGFTRRRNELTEQWQTDGELVVISWDSVDEHSSVARIDVAIVAAALADDVGIHYATKDSAIIARFSFHDTPSAASKLIKLPAPIASGRCIAIVVSAVDSAQLRSPWIQSNNSLCIDTTQPQLSGTLRLSSQAEKQAVDALAIYQEWRTKGLLRTIDLTTFAVSEVLVADPLSGIEAVAISLHDAQSDVLLDLGNVTLNGEVVHWDSAYEGYLLPWDMSRVYTFGVATAKPGDKTAQWPNVEVSPGHSDWTILAPNGVRVRVKAWNIAGAVADIPLGYVLFLDPATGGVEFQTDSVELFLPRSRRQVGVALHNFCFSPAACELHLAVNAMGPAAWHVDPYWASDHFADLNWAAPISDSSLLHHWSVALMEQCGSDQPSEIHSLQTGFNHQVIHHDMFENSNTTVCFTPTYWIVVSAHSLHGPVVPTQSASWRIDTTAPTVTPGGAFEAHLTAAEPEKSYTSHHAVWTAPPEEVAPNEIPLGLAALIVKSTNVTLSWCGFQEEAEGSAIHSYTVAVGTAPFLANLLAETSVAAPQGPCFTGEMVESGLGGSFVFSFQEVPVSALHHHMVLWVTIAAHDLAGNTVITSQPLLQVEGMPPIPSDAVFDDATVGFSNSMSNALFPDGTTTAVQSHGHAIAIAWKGFIDVNGDMEEYTVRVVTAEQRPVFLDRHGVEGDPGLLNTTGTVDGAEDSVNTTDVFVAADLPHLFGDLVSATYGAYVVEPNILGAAVFAARFGVPSSNFSVQDDFGSESVLQRQPDGSFYALLKPGTPLPSQQLFLVQVIGTAASGAASASWVRTPLYIDDSPPAVGPVFDGPPEGITTAALEDVKLTSTYDEVAMPFTNDVDCQPHTGIQAERHIPVVNMNIDLLLATARPLGYSPPDGTALPSSTLMTCEMLRRVHEFSTEGNVFSVPKVDDLLIVRRSTTRWNVLKRCSVIQLAASRWQQAQTGGAPSLLRYLDETNQRNLLKDFDIYAVIPLSLPVKIADVVSQLRLAVDTSDTTVLTARWGAIRDEESGLSNLTVTFRVSTATDSPSYLVPISTNAVQLIVSPSLPADTLAWAEVSACNVGGICSVARPKHGASDGVTLTCSNANDPACPVTSGLICLHQGTPAVGL